MHKNLKFNILSEGQKNGISVTCRKYNISRTIYYRWLNRYKARGIEGLNDIKKDFVPINKTNPEIELALFNLIRTYPNYGPRAIKYLLEEIGHNISESAVYNNMKRNNLTNKESRIRFAKKKEKKITSTIPPLSELHSGECWGFWITDYGHIENIGNLYEYTFFDFVSRITCTRLYHDISFSNFEDLLAGVAIPVAQTLKLNTKYLCFFHDSKIIKQTKNVFESKVNKAIRDHGFDVKIHVLKTSHHLTKITELRNEYTEGCLSFLMPLINKSMSFTDLKIQFQRYLRLYNISHKSRFDNELCSPIDYHKKLTNTKLILPLWAYIDREY